jgi:hypothetical protein
MQDSTDKPTRQPEKAATRRAGAVPHLVIACLFILGASVLLVVKLFLPDNPMKSPKSIGAVWAMIMVGYLFGFFRLLAAIQLFRKKR